MTARKTWEIRVRDKDFGLVIFYLTARSENTVKEAVDMIRVASRGELQAEYEVIAVDDE